MAGEWPFGATALGAGRRQPAPAVGCRHCGPLLRVPALRRLRWRPEQRGPDAPSERYPPLRTCRRSSPFSYNKISELCFVELLDNRSELLQINVHVRFFPLCRLSSLNRPQRGGRHRSNVLCATFAQPREASRSTATAF